MKNQSFLLKPMAFAVIAASASLSQLSFAAPIYTLTGEYILGASSGAAINALNDPGASIFDYSVSGGSGQDLSFSSSNNGNDVFFHSYGYESDTYGSSFGARISGNGTFYAKTSSSYSNTLTNTSGAAKVLNFTFNVAGGNLSVDGTSWVGMADLLLIINLTQNGVKSAYTWDHTHLTMALGGISSCSNDDSGVLGSYMSCGSSTVNSTFANDTLYSVDLGMFADGESVTIDYDIIATVAGDLDPTGNCSFYGDSILPVLMAVDGPGGSSCGGATSRSGDPAYPDWTPVTSFNTPVPGNNIPEPGSLVLLGLGLAGMGIARRRRNVAVV